MGVIRDVLDEVDDESKDMSGTGVTLPPLESHEYRHILSCCSTLTMQDQDGLRPRPGPAPRLLEGPRTGQTSLYQQRVLDVRTMVHAGLISRRTRTPKLSRQSSPATSFQTCPIYTPPTPT